MIKSIKLPSAEFLEISEIEITNKLYEFMKLSKREQKFECYFSSEKIAEAWDKNLDIIRRVNNE